MCVMPVMDMTPESLFAAIEPARKAGRLKALRVTRCSVRGCHLVGAYELTGRVVVIATPFKLSPTKATDLGLPRHVPGRAWLDEVPEGTTVACDHRLERL